MTLEKKQKKNAVRILADSTCDFSPEEAERSGVTIMPMNVVLDNKIYRQNIDITATEFYEKMASSETSPITAGLTIYDLENAYREATQDGSEVVAIILSSVLSGTYQSAVLMSHEVNGVYVVDSLNATFGKALLVREAVKLRDAGMSASEIAEKITALTKRVRLFAYVATLKYLVRGGRVSAVAGAIGGVLNICPLISVQDGAVINIGKARGKNLACKEITRLVEKSNIDKDYDVVFGYSIDETGLSALKENVSGLIKGCNTSDYEIGPIIGAHVGPGAVGLAFIAKE